MAQASASTTGQTPTAQTRSMAFSLAVAGVLALGLALRCLVLTGSRGLWLDEGYSWWVSCHSMREIMALIRGDTAPPLYYLVLHVWIKVFGDSEVAMRSMSVLAGTVSIALVGGITRKLYDTRIAVLGAMLLAAVMPLQVAWSQEVRAYAALSTTLLVACLGVVRSREATAPRWLAVYAVGAVLSVYLHNIAWFYLLGLNVAFLLLPGRTPLALRIRFLAIGNAIVVTLYAPWLPSLMEQMRFVAQNYVDGRPTWGDLLLQLGLSGGFSVEQSWAMVAHHLNAGYVIVGTCIACVLLGGRQNGRTAAALSLAAILPVIAIWAYSNVAQSVFIMPRVGIPAAAVLPVTLVAGLAGGSRWQKAIAGMVAAGMLAISAPGAWAGPDLREDWPQATRVINAAAGSGVKVVFLANEGELLYHYYCHRAGCTPLPATGLPARFEDGQPPHCLMRITSAADMAELGHLADDPSVQQIILVLTHQKRRDPHGLAAAYLTTGWRGQQLMATQRLSILAFDRVSGR